MATRTTSRTSAASIPTWPERRRLAISAGPMLQTPGTYSPSSIWIGEGVPADAAKGVWVTGRLLVGSPDATPDPRTPVSEGEEPVEERAVAAEGDAEVLGRDVVAARPLLLEALSLAREGVGEALHALGDERVGLLHGTARLVDEPRLDAVPAASEVAARRLVEQRRAARPGWCGS